MNIRNMMEKNIARAMILVLLMGIFMASFSVRTEAASALTASGKVCSKDGAYIRKGPSKATAIVGLLKNGTQVTILKEHFTANSTALDKKWYYISANGKKGYIRADLVNSIKNNAARTAWATDGLNFRQTPGTNGALLGSYAKGEAFYVVLPVLVKGSNATWYKVRNGSSFYYVVGSYITFSKPSYGNSSVTASKKVAGYVGGKVVQSAASKKVAEGAVAWAIKIANDNSFHYGNGANAHRNGCYFCGTQPAKKQRYVIGWEKTYCCNPFVHAAYAHGGKEPTMYKKCKGFGSYDWEDYKTSKLFAKLGHPAKSTLVKGDVLCFDGHVAMYIGNGQLVEAASEDDGVKYSRSWNKSIGISNLTDRRYKTFTHVYRYIGMN